MISISKLTVCEQKHKHWSLQQAQGNQAAFLSCLRNFRCWQVNSQQPLSCKCLQVLWRNHRIWSPILLVSFRHWTSCQRLKKKKSKVILGRHNKWTVMADLRKDKTINPINGPPWMDASNIKQNWQVHYNSQDNQHFPAWIRGFVLQVCPAFKLKYYLSFISFISARRKHPSLKAHQETLVWF